MRSSSEQLNKQKGRAQSHTHKQYKKINGPFDTVKITKFNESSSNLKLNI
jgi:hypothetical protein